MSMTKVVRVEDVDSDFAVVSGDVSNNKFAQVYHTSQPIQASYIGSTHEIYDDNEDDRQLERYEAQDKVYPLPENWPKIPQLFRRKSCELTKSSIPCVRKAVSHLELIQNIIEEWFKEKEDEIRSRLSSAAGGPVPGESRKQLRFAKSREDHEGDDKVKRTSSAISHITASSLVSSHSAFSVEGLGYTKDELEEGLDIPYLGAEDVIEEVITLLARLENDRGETQTALRNEKDKVVKLNGRIDALCLKRMQELPAVVQREHEACIMDLNELHWHVAYSSRNESRIKNRTNIAEVLNARLKDDIAFVKKHIPLVEEKLELELQAMNKIKNAQNDTNDELDNTKTRQEKTAAKSNEAEIKATTERTHIKRELDTVRDALSNISEELAEAKMTFNAYIHQINDIRQQLKDNAQELQVLDVKNENAKVAEEMQAAKVRDLQSKIAEAEFEFKRLENENTQLENDLTLRKNANDHKIQELDNAVKIRDSKYRKVLLRVQESEMEVQDFYDKVADCQRQKVADEKNIARIHKEMLKLQQQMAVTMEEYSKIATINTNIREQLNHEQERAFKTEESLKATVDTLKRQVKDEVHTRTVITARISSDNTDLTRYKTETKVKKDKTGKKISHSHPCKHKRSRDGSVMSFHEIDDDIDDEVVAKKVADEVTTAVKTVRVKVDKLRAEKVELDKKKEEYQSQAEETRKQKEESYTNFMSKIAEIQPHHTHLKNDVLALNKRLDHIQWKTELMNKQIDDMDREEGTMQRLVKNTERMIVELEEKMEELKLQLQAAQRIQDDLLITFNQTQARVRDNENKHRKFMEERTEFFTDAEAKKLRLLEHNKELASKYRKLQDEYMEIKNELTNNIDEKVKIENQIKDSNQLQSLQKRMHAAMSEYYKYRGMYNQSELERMKTESSINGTRVSYLQENMDAALKKITDFLQTQMDGSTARRIAWERVKKGKTASAGSGPESAVHASRQETMVQA